MPMSSKRRRIFPSPLTETMMPLSPMTKEFRLFSIPVFISFLLNLRDENRTRDIGVEGQTAPLHPTDRAHPAMREDLNLGIQHDPEALEMFLGFLIRSDADHPQALTSWSYP